MARDRWGHYTDFALTLGGWLGWVLLNIYSRTCRLAIAQGSDVIEDVRTGDRPVLVAFWHDSLLLLAPFLFHRLHRSGRPLTLLVSQSRDGELGTRILKHWRLDPVRGSSSRGGNRALRRLYHQMRTEGASPVVIPDGPRGPAHVAKPGLVTLAGLSGAPVLLLAAAGSPVYRIGSWDRMTVPWPFARVRLAATLLTPEELSSVEPARRSGLLEQRLADLIIGLASKQ